MKVNVFYNAECGKRFRLIKSEILFFGTHLGFCYNLISENKKIWIPVMIESNKNITHPIF